MNSIDELTQALSVGYTKSTPSGSELVIESLEPTLRITTYLDMPTRKVNGRYQPVLDIYNHFYEFKWQPHSGFFNKGFWIQIPSSETMRNPTVKHVFMTYKISRKRLTKYQLKKANRQLNYYLEFLLPEVKKNHL